MSDNNETMLELIRSIKEDAAVTRDMSKKNSDQVQILTVQVGELAREKKVANGRTAKLEEWRQEWELEAAKRGFYIRGDKKRAVGWGAITVAVLTVLVSIVNNIGTLWDIALEITRRFAA